MEGKTQKIAMFGSAFLAMGFFVYFTFIDKSNIVVLEEDLINPSRLDRSPSKQALYEKKRKKEREEFNFERKVVGLEDFFKDQVHRTPIPIDSLRQPEEVSKDVPKKTDTPGYEGMSHTYNSANIPLREQTKTSEIIRSRRMGFASGGVSNDGEFLDPGKDQSKIPVVVQENTQLSPGSYLKLRMIEESKIQGFLVPKNTFVLGKVRVMNERIYINVKSIPAIDGVIEVDLEGYDLHGNPGLAIEGGYEKEIKTDLLQHTVNEVQESVDIPLLKNVPFASARKRLRENTIPIEAGYKMYLREIK